MQSYSEFLLRIKVGMGPLIFGSVGFYLVQKYLLDIYMRKYLGEKNLRGPLAKIFTGVYAICFVVFIILQISSVRITDPYGNIAGFVLGIFFGFAFLPKIDIPFFDSDATQGF